MFCVFFSKFFYRNFLFLRYVEKIFRFPCGCSGKMRDIFDSWIIVKKFFAVRICLIAHCDNAARPYYANFFFQYSFIDILFLQRINVRLPMVINKIFPAVGKVNAITVFNKFFNKQCHSATSILFISPTFTMQSKRRCHQHIYAYITLFASNFPFWKFINIRIPYITS